MQNIFYVNTKNTTYALANDEKGVLRHLYWGKRLTKEELEVTPIWNNDSGYDNLLCEYTVFGGKLYRDCAFKCEYSDKCRDSVFLFENASQTDNELIITLCDKEYDAKIYLHYITYPDSDIITRYAEIENLSKDDIIIDKFMSAEMTLPSEMPYKIINTDGNWAAEFQKNETELGTGHLVFDSRKGITAHTNQPFFIAHQNADEQSGDVYFGALGYSGNFKVECQRDFKGITRVMLGMNDYDFSYTLKSGEKLESPKVYIGYSNGFAQMSNNMNRFAVNHILPENFADKPLPVLYNSWETTFFDVNVNNQLSVAKKARELGCELFVMDDGWFGARNDDHAGLGDWYVNQEKFPNGIDELIDGVNALGMDFGLWFEPEMVQKNSELYKIHPDWIYSYPKRKNNEQRNQLVLNLTKPEVEQFVFDCMDKMLEKHNIKYIKWDMNRPFSEIGAYNLENQQELWLRHTLAVYRVADRLKEKYPYLQLEACASGGGRADLGALEHFDMVWTSDNTDAYDRLTIQNGFSLLYPIKCMRAWVTDWNRDRRPVSLDFRFASSMQGSLSVGADLEKYSDEDMQKAKKYISLYKQIRNTVQFGNLYRLRTESEDGYWATQYVGDGKSVLFVMTNACTLDNKHYKHLNLRGLDENKMYSYTIDGAEKIKSGEYLMNAGIDLSLNNPFDAIITVFIEY